MDHLILQYFPVSSLICAEKEIQKVQMMKGCWLFEWIINSSDLQDQRSKWDFAAK